MPPFLKDVDMIDESAIGVIDGPRLQEAYPLFRQHLAQYILSGVPRPLRRLSNAVFHFYDNLYV